MFSLHRRFSLLLGLATLFPTGRALAQTSQGQRPDCSSTEHRQFDFWVGNWNVSAGGGEAGTNDVTLILGMCVVQEHWAGKGGGNGQSFNFYDRADGKWHQLWVDDAGFVLELAGRFADGKMMFNGETIGKDGKRVLQRLTFFDNHADGTVRQLWESSSDQGQTWQVSFDGLYRRKQ